MQEFDAVKFYEIGSRLSALSRGLPALKGKLFNKSNSGFFVQELTKMKGLCDPLGLRVSVKHIERLIDDLNVEPPNFLGVTYEAFGQRINELQRRITDELESHVFFKIQSGKEHFYTQRDLFGSQVSTAFLSIIDDIEEAGKSFALSRYTACVFHLMRVMEAGIRALGKSLGDPTLDPSNNPNWGQILARCDQELQRPKRRRSPVWQSNDAFFSEATANLRAIKDAWRNPTMHVERSYNEESALDIFNSVRAFMRHLATRLKE